MSNIHLCSFADTRMSPMLDRLCQQALAFGEFKSILLYTEKDFDDDFKSIFKGKNPKTLRGYGFWAWKPFIILKALKQIPEGDILLYLDAGCHLNKKGILRFREYIQMLKSNQKLFLTFELAGDRFMERNWTKGCLLDYFKVKDDPLFTDTNIRDASTIFCVNHALAVQFMEEWYSIFQNHLHLADDSVSTTPNLEGFIEHRFDQSIYSVLAKKKILPFLSSKEIYTTNWAELANYPIWEKKDKKIKIQYKYSLSRFCEKTLSKLTVRFK